MPGKVLLAETGLPLIQHTINAAWQAGFTNVVAVTDSMEILKGIDSACYTIMSGPAASGTDRIASVLDEINDLTGDESGYDLIVNLQSDEPEIKPEHLDALIDAYQQFPGCDIATLATAIAPGDVDNPDVVKVDVSPTYKFAYHFWRTAESENDWKLNPDVRRHAGIYAYSPRFLKWISSQPVNHWEEVERLEQLRAYYLNCRIRVAIVDHPYHGIDTREQYDAFVARWKAKHNG